MRYIFLLLVFVFMVFYLVKDSDKHMKKMNKYLDNSIIFEGQVNRIQVSNNHAFGILELKIIQSNVKEFDQKPKNGIYPYKIRNGIAELYGTVSIERKAGDYVKVVSNEHIIYFNPQDSKEKGSLYLLSDPNNIDFVKKNTCFK